MALRTNWTAGQTGHDTAHNDIAVAVNSHVAHPSVPALNARDYGGLGDGSRLEDAAVQAAFTAARAAATAVGERRNGLPPVHIPAGTWRLSQTLLRDQERGLVISGDGARSTILRVTTGVPVFELHRSSEITIRDMTICCGDPAGPWVDGLIEGSTGVLVRERGDDPGLGNATVITFVGCEFVGLHRGLRFTGNQMGDNVTFEHCKWTDNFIDLEYLNGQSINHRVLGGEVIAWVNAAESAYNARLASWTAASVPVTARPGQLSNPADPLSPTQAVTVRDGAVLRSVAGGGVLWIDTSFIARKSWLLLGGMPTVAAVAVDTHGTDSNVMPYTFLRCSGELRHNEAEHSLPGDTYGYERCTALRYERPHPAYGDKTLRAIVDHAGGRYTQQATSLDVLHLANGVNVLWRDGTRVNGGTGTTLVSLLTSGGSTAGDRGHYVGRDSTILTRRRVGKTSAGAAWTPPGTLDHLIRHEGVLAGSSATAPVPEYDRVLSPGFPFPVRRVIAREPDGKLIGSGVVAAVGTTRPLPAPAGAVITRVGVSLTGFASAGTVPPAEDITIRFRDSAGLVYADLVARWSEVAGALTYGANGARLTPHRKPWADVEAIANAAGTITVEVLTGTASTTNVYGYIWAELL